jgi:hypothetical protein
MNDELSVVAPAFVEVAHRIVWATVATTDGAGRPTTRVLHPIWEWDGTNLTGWILTSPRSPKARHLAAQPAVSLTYWHPNQDVATADCDSAWETSDMERQAGWDRFLHGPKPVGYDPSIIPQWTSPQAPDLGVLRLEPRTLRVMPGTVMTKGEGALLTWRRP